MAGSFQKLLSRICKCPSKKGKNQNLKQCWYLQAIYNELNLEQCVSNFLIFLCKLRWQSFPRGRRKETVLVTSRKRCLTPLCCSFLSDTISIATRTAQRKKEQRKGPVSASPSLTEMNRKEPLSNFFLEKPVIPH